MKNNLLIALIAGTAIAIGATGCSKKVVLPTSTTEEAGLNLQKITDEANNTVLGCVMERGSASYPSFAMMGTNREHNVHWGAARTLSVSPDGSEIAYLTRVKDRQNIMVRGTNGSNAVTQRTSRHVGDFCWAPDDKLYFIDIDGTQNKVTSTDAHAGTYTRQITSNNVDYEPIVSPDCTKVFFVRYDKNSGPTIWNYDLESGQLTTCAPGFQPTGISDDNDEFYCARNSEKGYTEIWKVNYVTGRETRLLSDQDRSFTHPALSPDGEWLLVTGNSKSTINQKKNLDIFALKLDGSNTLLQLTFHPGNDTNPQWSPDGQYIYFISDRANKDDHFNVWRMNFNHNSLGSSSRAKNYAPAAPAAQPAKVESTQSTPAQKTTTARPKPKRVKRTGSGSIHPL